MLHAGQAGVIPLMQSCLTVPNDYIFQSVLLWNLGYSTIKVRKAVRLRQKKEKLHSRN